MKKNINEELKEEKLAESISKTMENDLVKIQEVLDLDLKNLVDVVDSLPNDKKDKVLSLIINKQLEKLKKSLTMDIYIVKFQEMLMNLQIIIQVKEMVLMQLLKREIM